MPVLANETDVSKDISAISYNDGNNEKRIINGWVNVAGVAKRFWFIDTVPQFLGTLGTLSALQDINVIPFQIPVATGNDPFTYSVTNLPTGMTFNPSSRFVSGAPTQAGTYTVTYSVEDGDGDTNSATFTVVVSPTTRTYSTPGSYTFSKGAWPFYTVECWGGGAGGERVTDATGGGGGGYTSRKYSNSQLSDSEPVAVGRGGIVDTQGRDSTFRSMTAGGGAHRSGNGGTATGGTTNETGGQGGSSTSVNGGNTTYAGGGGGGIRTLGNLEGNGGNSSFGGDGGDASFDGSASSGSAPGGGGGASDAGTAAGGGNGRVRITGSLT